MGYESKIYFCKSYKYSMKEGSIGQCEIVATIDMGKMGYGYYDDITSFVRAFDTETPFSIYDEVNEIEDCYGNRLCYGDKEILYQKMKEIAKNHSGCVRFKWLRDMLKTFKDDPDIYVVHYGY